MADEYIESERRRKKLLDAISRNPRNADLHDVYANFLIQHSARGNKAAFEEAAQHFEEAIRLNPHLIEAINCLGLGKMFKGELDKAEELFQRCLELDRNYCRAWRNLSRIASRREDYTAAIRLMKEAVERDPADAAGWRSLGDLYRHSAEDAEKARQCFERALAVDSRNVPALQSLAGEVLSKGNPTMARLLLQHCVSLVPNSFSSNCALAELCDRHLQCFDAAKKHYEEALSCSHAQQTQWQDARTQYKALLQEKMKLEDAEVDKLMKEVDAMQPPPLKLARPIPKPPPYVASVLGKPRSSVKCTAGHPTIFLKEGKPYVGLATWSCNICARAIDCIESERFGVYYCPVCQADYCYRCIDRWKQLWAAKNFPREVIEQFNCDGEKAIIEWETPRVASIKLQKKGVSVLVSQDSSGGLRSEIRNKKKCSLFEALCEHQSQSSRVGDVRNNGGFHEAKVLFVVRELLSVVKRHHANGEHFNGKLSLSTVFISPHYFLSEDLSGPLEEVTVFPFCDCDDVADCWSIGTQGSWMFVVPDEMIGISRGQRPTATAKDLWAVACIWGSLVTGTLPWYHSLDSGSFTPVTPLGSLSLSDPSDILSILIQMNTRSTPFELESLTFLSSQALVLLDNMFGDAGSNGRECNFDCLDAPYFSQNASLEEVESSAMYRSRVALTCAHFSDSEVDRRAAQTIVETFHSVALAGWREGINVARAWGALGNSLRIGETVSLELKTAFTPRERVDFTKIDCYRHAVRCFVVATTKRDEGDDEERCTLERMVSWSYESYSNDGTSSNAISFTCFPRSTLDMLLIIDTALNETTQKLERQLVVQDLNWAHRREVRLELIHPQSMPIVALDNLAVPALHEKDIRQVARTLFQHLKNVHKLKQTQRSISRKSVFCVDSSCPFDLFFVPPGLTSFKAHSHDAIECFNGQYLPATDVYFAGVMLLELSLGAQTADGIRLVPPPFISPLFKDFLSQTLHPIPSLRASPDQLLSHQWFSDQHFDLTATETEGNFLARCKASVGATTPPIPSPVFPLKEVSVDFVRSAVSHFTLSWTKNTLLMEEVDAAVQWYESAVATNKSATTTPQRQPLSESENTISWLLSDDPTTKINVHVEGLSDILFYAGLFGVNGLAPYVDMQSATEEFCFFKDGVVLRFELESSDVNPFPIVGVLQRGGLKTEKTRFAYFRDNDLMVVTAAKAKGVLQEMTDEKRLKPGGSDVWYFHHKLRWGRAIENYQLPVTAPLHMHKTNPRLAFEFFIEVFSTISKQIFPSVEKPSDTLSGIIGTGWIAWGEDNVLGRRSLEYSERLCKMLCATKSTAKLLDIFFELQHLPSLVPDAKSRAERSTAICTTIESIFVSVVNQPAGHEEEMNNIREADQCAKKLKFEFPRLLSFLVAIAASSDKCRDASIIFSSGGPKAKVTKTKIPSIKEFVGRNVLADCAVFLLQSTQDCFWALALDGVLEKAAIGRVFREVFQPDGDDAPKCSGMLLGVGWGNSPRLQLEKGSFSCPCLACGLPAASHFGEKYLSAMNDPNLMEALTVVGSYGFDSHSMCQHCHGEYFLGDKMIHTKTRSFQENLLLAWRENCSHLDAAQTLDSTFVAHCGFCKPMWEFDAQLRSSGHRQIGLALVAKRVEETTLFSEKIIRQFGVKLQHRHPHRASPPPSTEH